MRQRIVSIGEDNAWYPTVYNKYTYPNLTLTPPLTKTYYMRGRSFTAVDERCSNLTHGRRSWHPFSHYKKTAVPCDMPVDDYSERTYMYRTFGEPSCWIGYPDRTVDMFNCARFGTASNPTVGLPAMSGVSEDGELYIPDPQDLDLLLGSSFQDVTRHQTFVIAH